MKSNRLAFCLTILFLLPAAALLSRFRTDSDIIISDRVMLRHVCDSVYVHVTRDSLRSYGWFSSNGMVVVKNGRALLVDTPMDDTKTAVLVTYLRDFMHVYVDCVIVSHFHDDCLGGLNYIHRSGIPSFCGSRTADICRDSGLPVCSSVFCDSMQFSFQGLTIICRFFGAGHTRDNIVTLIPEKQVLFGGCLIRAAEAQGLGNLSDACVEQWENTVQRVKALYGEVAVVIPGHGMYGGPELLDHTVGLVQAYVRAHREHK